MTPKFSFAPILLATAALVHASEAAVQHQAVADLGRLNGLALQCKYLDQVRVMKAAVVANAPKQRSYGLAFDEATNEAFLEHIRTGQACPGPAGFAQRVEAAVIELQQAFESP